MDEFFESMTLIQTHKVDRFPVVLIGRQYWKELMKWMAKYMDGDNTYIDPEDIDLCSITDDLGEAVHILQNALSAQLDRAAVEVAQAVRRQTAEGTVMGRLPVPPGYRPANRARRRSKAAGE